MKLVIDNVSKNFIDPQGKQLSVLENVSLTVHSEEFVALVGPSGCGKSTLLNLTAGLLSPSDGSIYFTDLAEDHTPGAAFMKILPLDLKPQAYQRQHRKNGSSTISI